MAMEPSNEDIINDLSVKIAQLTYDNAALKSVIKQYEAKAEATKEQD